jgi:hypothetical protein
MKMARMSSRREPLRVTDDPRRQQPELAAAIRGLRGEHGTADAVHALEQRLLAKLGANALDGTDAPAAPTAPTPPTSQTSLRIVTRTVLTLAGLALFGLPSLHARHAESEPRRGPAVSSPPASVETREVALPAPAPAESVPVLLPTAAAPLVHGSLQRRRTLPPTAAVPEAIARPALQDPKGELELLQRAHAALRRHDSSAALELVDQHAHDYPQGVFAQEREVLAVQTLLKKQRRPEAIARAQQFVSRFGDSSYAFRMRSLIEQTPRPVPSVLVSDADPELTTHP